MCVFHMVSFFRGNEGEWVTIKPDDFSNQSWLKMHSRSEIGERIVFFEFLNEIGSNCSCNQLTTDSLNREPFHLDLLMVKKV